MFLKRHQIKNFYVSLRIIYSGLLLMPILLLQALPLTAQEAIISHNADDVVGDGPTRILFVFDA
jgi:hypothetical protein